MGYVAVTIDGIPISYRAVRWARAELVTMANENGCTVLVLKTERTAMSASPEPSMSRADQAEEAARRR